MRLNSYCVFLCLSLSFPMAHLCVCVCDSCSFCPLVSIHFSANLKNVLLRHICGWFESINDQIVLLSLVVFLTPSITYGFICFSLFFFFSLFFPFCSTQYSGAGLILMPIQLFVPRRHHSWMILVFAQFRNSHKIERKSAHKKWRGTNEGCVNTSLNTNFSLCFVRAL